MSSVCSLYFHLRLSFFIAVVLYFVIFCRVIKNPTLSLFLRTRSNREEAAWIVVPEIVGRRLDDSLRWSPRAETAQSQLSTYCTVYLHLQFYATFRYAIFVICLIHFHTPFERCQRHSALRQCTYP